MRAAPSWLDSSVQGRELHQYRRGHGLESITAMINYVFVAMVSVF